MKTLSTPARKSITNTRSSRVVDMYSVVQINLVQGCLSAVLVHATFDPVYLDSRVYLFRGRAGLNDPIWRRVVR